MIHLSRRGGLRRPLASVVAATVGAAGLAVLAPAPAAHAQAPVDATLTWGVSGYVTAAAGTFSFSMADFVGTDGATVDATAKTVTFSGGAGRTDLGTHETEVDYQGSLQFGYTGRYLFHFTDPSVVVDQQGNGRIVADIDWSITGGESGSAADVVLTTFTSDDDAWDGSRLQATPAWAGAVAADRTYQVTTGGSSTPVDQPVVDGASWAPDLVESLPLSVRAFFFKTSSSATQALKAPAAFSATVPGPKVTVGAGSVADGSVRIPVTGAGFTGVTNPGDAGVYVGLAPAGGLPDVTTQAGMASFATAAWISAGAITGGAFSTTLTAAAADVDPATAYAVYTWQAHTHSNTTQDTETPVSIDWAALRPVQAGAPSVMGVAQVGRSLAARAGTWGPTGVALTYQWLVDGTPIAGATASTLALTPALASRRVAVAVTGSLAPATPVTRTSAAVAVARGTLAVGKPRIVGKAKVGTKVRALVSVPAGATVGYQWLRGGKAIKGAHAATLRVTKKLRGQRLSVRVTVTRSGYATVTTNSARTAKVRR